MDFLHLIFPSNSVTAAPKFNQTCDQTLNSIIVLQGPFDVSRKVFVGGEETSHMTLNDKSDLFFHDYSLGPLFVQENYIHVTPFAARYVGHIKRSWECHSDCVLAHQDLYLKKKSVFFGIMLILDILL